MSMTRQEKPERCAVLHNIRSNYNVGSIFRSADGAGISRIYLSGYTPAPVDRFGRANKELAKTALGAECMVPWERAEDIGALIAALKKKGMTVAAVEQDPRSCPYTAYIPQGSIAYIFGAEVEGLPEDVLALADNIIEIPLLGKKESLNVSVCAGIVFFHARDAVR